MTERMHKDAESLRALRKKTSCRVNYDQPRPNSGILVAITVRNGTFDSSGSPAM